MRTAAILPIKRFSLAKQRLGESVTEQLRFDLTRAMVGDVLVALSQCAAIDLTIVVTNEPTIAAAANYTGAIIVADTAESGQSAAVSTASSAPWPREPAGTVHPRRLPSPGPWRARRSAARRGRRGHRHPRPSRHRHERVAANATRRDDAQLGPGSCERHGKLATSADASWRTEQVSSLQLDIDTGADLAVLRERLAGNHGQAPRTRSVLGMVERHWRSSQPAA